MTPVKFGEASCGGNPEPNFNKIVEEGVETGTIRESGGPVLKDPDNLDSVSYKRSLVIGTLLGDTYSRGRRAHGKQKAEYRVCHGLSQADYVEWKAQEFNRLFKVDVKVHHQPQHSRVCFYLSQRRRLRVIHDWFHRNNQKVITDKIRFMDHPIGLSMLLCDDGSVRKRKKKHRDGTVYYLNPSITIATHNFDLCSVENLLHHIENLCGAKGCLNPEKRWRAGQLREYNRINFNIENSRKMWEYVSPFIPQIPSMLAKFAFAYERFRIVR